MRLAGRRRSRDTVNGRYVTPATTAAHPDTTVTETIKPTPPIVEYAWALLFALDVEHDPLSPQAAGAADALRRELNK